MGSASDRASEHGSDKEGGREHASRGAADEGEGGGDDFQEGEECEKFPGELAVHGLVDVLVAGAHHLRSSEKADDADEESGGGRLEVLRPAGQGFQARADVADKLGENDGGDASDDAEHGVGEELDGLGHGDDGNAEERFGAKIPAYDDDAGDSREDDSAEDPAAPAADDFLDDEEDSRNGGIEGGGQSGGGADGGEQTLLLGGELQTNAEERGDAG